MEIRTDLAMEAREARGELAGVAVEEASLEGLTITRVRVLDGDGARSIGKPVGTYVTVECPDLPRRDPRDAQVLQDAIARELAAMLPKKERLTALVAGLGNWNLTPDALGPKTVEKVWVTRHIKGKVPGDLDARLREVSAISPGVLGITGVETGEILRGVVERVKPDVLLCIDSLAARRTSRILTTVQMADTGVMPGSGVGNARSEISSRTMGVPVVAIGVPMVVHAVTISSDAIQALTTALQEAAGEGSEIYRMLSAFGEEGLREAVRQTLPEEMGHLIVTPSGIDDAVEVVAGVVAMGLNIALHPEVERDEMAELMV